MKKWNMTIQFAFYMDYEVEANTYDEAVSKAMRMAKEERDSAFRLDSAEFTEIALHDYEEMPEEE